MELHHKIGTPSTVRHRTLFRLAVLALLLSLPLPGCATPFSPLSTSNRHGKQQGAPHYPTIIIYIGSG